MGWLRKDTKRLLAEMAVGVVAYNLVCLLGSMVLMPYLKHPVLPVAGGFLAGMVGALLMLVHMAIITEQVLSSGNESYANKKTALHAMLRRILYVAAVLVLWKGIGLDLLAIALGTLGMKAGAYLQPWVHRQIERRSIQS